MVGKMTKEKYDGSPIQGIIKRCLIEIARLSNKYPKESSDSYKNASKFISYMKKILTVLQDKLPHYDHYNAPHKIFIPSIAHGLYKIMSAQQKLSRSPVYFDQSTPKHGMLLEWIVFLKNLTDELFHTNLQALMPFFNPAVLEIDCTESTVFHGLLEKLFDSTFIFKYINGSESDSFFVLSVFDKTKQLQFKSYLYLLSQLPENYTACRNSYMFCRNNETKDAESLYYIKPTGISEHLKINDVQQFKKTLQELSNSQEKGSKKLYLNKDAIMNLIKKHTGHVPEVTEVFSINEWFHSILQNGQDMLEHIQNPGSDAESIVEDVEDELKPEDLINLIKEGEQENAEAQGVATEAHLALQALQAQGDVINQQALQEKEAAA